SLDGGLTWLAANTGVIGSINLDEGDINGFFDGFADDSDKEFLAVGPNYSNLAQDRFVVVWHRNGVVYASSSLDGISWSTPVQVSNVNAGDDHTQPSGSAIDSIPTFGP